MKFPASSEDPDCGIMEKAYMDCAQQCGIIVPETRLLPSRRCSGYFAARRFDRTFLPDGSLQRVHMLTVAAILELDWRAPSLDYHALMKLTRILCRDRKSELEQMFRRMCLMFLRITAMITARTFLFSTMKKQTSGLCHRHMI